MSIYGSRYITGAKCQKCGVDLPDLRTSRDGGWLFVRCHKCNEFHGVPDCLKNGGKLVQ